MNAKFKKGDLIKYTHMAWTDMEGNTGGSIVYGEITDALENRSDGNNFYRLDNKLFCAEHQLTLVCKAENREDRKGQKCDSGK